jgi:hypothetical protein
MKRQGTFTLKGNFSASQASRTSVSYSLDEIAPQKLLLERAITARATMKAWCDLRGITPMAFVTMPLPEPLQELQVRTRLLMGWLHQFAHLLRPLLGVSLPQVRLMEGQVEDMRPKMQHWRVQQQESVWANERQASGIDVDEDLGNPTVCPDEESQAPQVSNATLFWDGSKHSSSRAAQPQKGEFYHLGPPAE